MAGDVSFTHQVVAELAPHVPVLPCCRRALLDGMLLASDAPGVISTTRLPAARAAMHAMHMDDVPAHVRRVASPRRLRYVVSMDGLASMQRASANTCCTRSRLRGAFVSGGTLQRPDAGPHVEIACVTREAAEYLVDDATALGIDARARAHRRRWRVTVRTAAAVGALLSSIGAQSGRLEFEGGRVVRELRAGVNRRLNAETANLRRSARAGALQLAAAEVLERDPAAWAALPAAVRQAAALRRMHPQDDLVALAHRARCSKSAMAGRLRRLVDVADTTFGRVDRRSADGSV